jgi:hypothetical protein
VREGTAVFAGRARGIDPLGRLEVVVARGVVRRVEAGDVRLLD